MGAVVAGENVGFALATWCFASGVGWRHCRGAVAFGLSVSGDVLSPLSQLVALSSVSWFVLVSTLLFAICWCAKFRASDGAVVAVAFGHRSVVSIVILNR